MLITLIIRYIVTYRIQMNSYALKMSEPNNLHDVSTAAHAREPGVRGRPLGVAGGPHGVPHNILRLQVRLPTCSAF